MDGETFTIRVSGKDPDSINADDVIRALEDALEIFQGASDRGDDSPKSDWMIIGASMASPLTLTVRSRGINQDSVPRPVVKPVLAGLRSIEYEERRPPFFSDRMLRSAVRLGSLLENGLAKIEIETTEGEKYQPTPRLKSSAQSIRRKSPPYYTTNTILEGTLEKIDVHGKPEFYIYDRLTNDAIRCFFSRDNIDVVGSMLDKRVRVSGVAKFRRNHEPVSVEVRDFESVTAAPPRLSELHARGVDITGGKASEDYIRAIRQ